MHGTGYTRWAVAAAMSVLLGNTACESCEFGGVGATVRLTVEGAPADVVASVCHEVCYDDCSVQCFPLSPEDASDGAAVFSGTLYADNDDVFGCSLPAFELRAEAPGCTTETIAFDEGATASDDAQHDGTVTLDCGG